MEDHVQLEKRRPAHWQAPSDPIEGSPSTTLPAGVIRRRTRGPGGGITPPATQHSDNRARRVRE